MQAYTNVNVKIFTRVAITKSTWQHIATVSSLPKCLFLINRHTWTVTVTMVTTAAI